MYLTQTLHRALLQDPDRVMTIYGDRVRTVAESVDRIARLATALRTVGVESNDRVGLLARNSDRYHETLLAVAWADAVVNPINIRWGVSEIAHALKDSDTRLLVVDEHFADLVLALRQEAPGLATVIFCGDAPCPEEMLDYEDLVAKAEPAEDARRGGDQLFGVFYTGGTTGRSKGVMLSHRNLLTSALGSQAHGDFVIPRGRVLHAAPMFHLADLAMWTAALLVDSAHVIVPIFDPVAVLTAISNEGVTDTLLVPTMVQLLVDHPDVDSFERVGLRRLLYGGSPISEAVLKRARKAFPAAGFTQAFGMTELSPVATLLTPTDHEDPALLRSAGRSAPHVELRIVDADGNDVPRGTAGEVLVRGDNVMLGYWKQPDLTASTLRGGWMHTGDGGYLDDRGYLFITDRLKDMIVTGGENVYSAEVENVLALHPTVAACAVIGVPDERWGERVHAVVVLKRDEDPPPIEDLRAFCRAHLADYKTPRSVAFVDALPMSGAGKVLKRELREEYWERHGRNVS